MPVSGLAITLTEDREQQEAALAALRAHPNIEVGQQHGHRLPIVVDTETDEADKDVWRWLHEQPGVRFVDVVTVHHDDGPSRNRSGSNPRSGHSSASSDDAGDRQEVGTSKG